MVFWLIIGTEQEWKLAQSNVEVASNGLHSATNDLCIASLKAKSASGHISFLHQLVYLIICMHLHVGSLDKHAYLFLFCICIYGLHLKHLSFVGDLQSTVLAMRDCAYEANVALSAFARVSRGHTALTSESGSMLEEVFFVLCIKVYNIKRCSLDGS